MDFYNNNKILYPKAKRVSSVALIGGGGLLVIVILLVVWYMTGTESPPKVVDCKLSEWSTWKDCTSDDSCPSGKNRFRSRTVIEEPSENGKACGELREHMNEDNCELSAWSTWRACDDGECEGGTNEIRTREATGECDGESMVQYRYEQPTPIPCELSAWSKWRACDDGECENGNNETRTRTIDQKPNGTGMRCDALVEYRHVDPIDCEMSAWSPWTSCGEDDQCTGEFRERTVMNNENYLGSCPERDNLKETRNVPKWGHGKICGENTGSYCLMPFGMHCARGKDIPKDRPNGGRCKEAVKEIAGISEIKYYSTGSVPRNCSYKKNQDGFDVVGHGSSYSKRPFSDHMAVCLN